MNRLTVANEVIELEMLPAFGARLTSLVDRRTGREWLVTGPALGSDDDGALYGGEQARGWDECFPTVAPCHDSEWGGRLRDHGALWGRPWQCDADSERFMSVFRDERFVFERTILLSGPEIRLTYSVRNPGSRSVPYLWSQHCLLAAQPGESVILRGTEDPAAAGSFREGVFVNEPASWPGPPDLPEMDRVQPLAAGVAAKFYAPCRGDVVAGISGEDGSIHFGWSAADIPYLGVWLDYGGWPADQPVHQVALEPTTGAADDLAAARRLGMAQTLAPAATHSWEMTITVFSEDIR